MQVTPVDSKQTSEIEIIELRLINRTQIEQLQYNAANHHRLALSLNPVKDNLSTHQPNKLELYWGSQPLNFVLENYRIPDFNFPSNASESQPLQDLKFTPGVSDQQIKLTGTIDLSINLPDPKTVDSSGWFWSGVPVKNVQLSTLERTGSEVSDEIDRSTLLNGKVYMAEQTLEIEPNQLLLVKPPGIQRINHLQIKPQGIEVRVSGETQKIEVGLDPNLPISSIQSNWWTRHFSKEEAVAIISFSTALMTSLLLWLVDNIFKGSSIE